MRLAPRLLLVSLVTLGLPWAGCQYLQDVERALRDGQADTLRVNSAYERITGLSRVDVVGRNMRDLVREGVFDVSVTLAVDRAAASRVVREVERTGGRLMVAHTLRFDAVVLRLREQVARLQRRNGSVPAYPDVDWQAFADRLVNDVLGLRRCRVTTQIEHYDNLAAFCDGLKRLNTILIDLNRDLWTYISLNYFRQKIKKGEVGSSTMPHKVNPIDFENAEGNLGVANALLEHLAAKLPISRLQRDLTDSTVTRNIGVPLAHTVIALKSLRRGLDKLMIDTAVIAQDLEANWAVVTEGIQTVLRRVGYPNPYEALKALARTNKPIDQDMIRAFIDELDVEEEVKNELKHITPHNYTGVKLI